MIKEDTRNKITSLLSDTLKENIIYRSEQSLSGGDINEAYRIETDAGYFFVKLNSASRFPGMFEKEARGLSLLAKPAVIPVPEVILHGEANDDSFLILQNIESGSRASGFWDEFGKNLAKLHRNHAEAFGLKHDNYIGSLPQYNHQHPDWSSFFIEERLQRQLKMAVDAGRVDRSFNRAFDRLFLRMQEIFPEEPPALLHGDLWNGNFMVNEKGKACIIDPAVYYGHREMDLGMSKLFGGFASEFYHAYNDEFPLEKGWEKRVDICNLYPLMVHVNLFGGAYAASVKNILNHV
ncbi:MAG: fructosamine kinase family protein [Bacteroidota bacterium]|nr:fructosamine kinase family protein [Bacteroidota bacterium]